jgi:hypothetical protein
VGTTTASGWFEALTANTVTGPIAKFPSKMSFEYLQGGKSVAVVDCASTAATKATGFWTIQTSEETSKTSPKEQKQPATKFGPHEALTIQKWGGSPTFGNSCEAKLAATNVPAKLNECRLQVAQPIKGTGETEAPGSVQTDCKLEIGEPVTCKVTIEQMLANHQLQTIFVSNEPVNGVKIKANVTGITAKAIGCPGVPENTNEQTFKTGASGNEPIVTFGQKLA